MDKQQFDHIENRIRKASDDISVPLSAEAWNKMELKLDKEFNKKRRRGIIWWWLSSMLLAIVVSGIFFYNKHKQSVVSSTQVPGTSSVTIREPSTSGHSNAKITLLKDNDNKRQNLQETEKAIPGIKNNKKEVLLQSPPVNLNAATVNEPGDYKPGRKKAGTNYGSATTDKFTLATGKDKSRSSKFASLRRTSANGIPPASFNLLNNNYDRAPALSGTAQHKYKAAQSSESTRKAFDTVSDSSVQAVLANSTKAIEPLAQRDSSLSLDSISKKSTAVKLKSDRTPSRGVYFTASIAGDATDIKGISITQTKPVYGAGLGYRFNNKLSLQTGFYFGKKVYTAGPDDYELKPGSYIAKIISAKADCYIYDFPIALKYDILHQKKYNVYVTTGLSSYILKREKYDIRFLNPMGTYRHMAYTYKRNVDFFSVFNLSLGYEHKMTNALYLQVESYLKLPLAGLGEGAVKLQSAALQFGIKYQPLKK